MDEDKGDGGELGAFLMSSAIAVGFTVDVRVGEDGGDFKSTLRLAIFAPLKRSNFPRGVGLVGSIADARGRGNDAGGEIGEEGEFLADTEPEERELLPILEAATVGLDSRLLVIPKRCSSSRIVGLPSRLLLSDPRCVGLALLALTLSRFLGVRSRLKQLSKQSVQEGLPKTSTIWAPPIFLKHPSQLKQRLCQYLWSTSIKPPSDFKARTGRAHVGHVPFEPPLVVKHGRQRNRCSSDEVGSG